jgi:hypothetical protein
VAALQILLNRSLTRGCTIDVDGIYGRNTRQAVLDYQRRNWCGRDGTAGPETWGALLLRSPLRVIDAVDITDPSLASGEAADLRGAGGNPMITGGMSNGVEDVINRIRSRAGGNRSILLLRFHGHGTSGIMGVADGEGHVVVLRSAISLDNLPTLTPVLRRLRPLFVEFGSVELHGCQVARLRDGRTLVRRLAAIWGVPVSAGVQTQYGGGGIRRTLRFEGPVFTAFPGGGNVRSWARGLRAASEGRCVAGV